MRLYLDACCLNRPFDDQSQLRVRLETVAVLTILQLCEAGVHEWIGSTVLRHELGKTPDDKRRQRTTDLLEMASEIAEAAPADRTRAGELELLGFTVSGHPLDQYEGVRWDSYCTITSLSSFPNQRVTVCGLIIADRSHH